MQIVLASSLNESHRLVFVVPVGVDAIGNR